MPDLAVIASTEGGPGLPTLITGTGERATWRFLEFFVVDIRNPNTRVAYARTAGAFLRWCAAQGIGELGAHCEATSCLHPDAVRLAGNRPGGALQSGKSPRRSPEAIVPLRDRKTGSPYGQAHVAHGRLVYGAPACF